MMLKTFSNKTNPATSMFSFTFKKNAGIIVLFSIIMLLVSPGYMIMHITDKLNSMKELSSAATAVYNADRMILEFGLFALIIAGIGVVLFNLINFNFLYSKRSSDFYHSLPLKRTELIVSRMAAGIVSTLIPVTLGYLGMLATVLCIPGVTGNISYLLMSYLYMLMAVLICSSFSMIFVVCSGTVLDLVISFIGINIGLIVTAVIIDELASVYLNGYCSNVLAYLRNFSPFVYIVDAYNGYAVVPDEFTFANAAFFIRGTIYTVLFYAISTILYKYRKAERGGDTFAYKFLYVICSVIVGFCAAFAVGMIFSPERFGLFFWIFGLIGAIVACVAYGAITDRGFKSFKKSIIISIGAYLIIVLCALVLKCDLFGYSKRVPAVSDIQSVDVSYFEEVSFTDPLIPLELHRKIVNDDLNIVDFDKSTKDAVTVDFVYTLNSGKSIRRSYTVEVEEIANQLLEIEKSTARTDTINSNFFFAKNQSYNLSYYDNEADEDIDRSFSVNINQRELKELFNIYKSELKKADKDIITDRSRQYEIQYYNESENEDYRFTISVDDNFTETVKTIEKLHKAHLDDDKE